MGIKSILGASCTCLAIVSFNVNAAIIDNDLYTTDTTSGLDWLDISDSVDLSYNQVQSNLLCTTCTYSGWRYADITELYAFWLSNGVVEPTSGFSGASSINEGKAAIIFDLIDRPMFAGGPVGTAELITTSNIGPGPIVNLMQEFTDTEDVFHLGQKVIDKDYSLSISASMLVRESVSSVPVSSAVWLFSSGLLGLVGVARRKKA